jgi:hypothetical protein
VTLARNDTANRPERTVGCTCVPHPAVCYHCFEPAVAGGCPPIGCALADRTSRVRLPLVRYWLKTLIRASRARQETQQDCSTVGKPVQAGESKVARRLAGMHRTAFTLPAVRPSPSGTNPPTGSRQVPGCMRWRLRHGSLCGTLVRKSTFLAACRVNGYNGDET